MPSPPATCALNRTSLLDRDRQLARLLRAVVVSCIVLPALVPCVVLRETLDNLSGRCRLAREHREEHERAERDDLDIVAHSDALARVSECIKQASSSPIVS